MKKLIVIVGPTASGKSELAVKLAKKFNGEVISADSRQVYKNLNIGSGKVPLSPCHSKNLYILDDRLKCIENKLFCYKNIPHHLISIVSPRRTFAVAQYQKLAQQKIRDVWQRGKIPILCGGTGLYIQAVVDGLIIPSVFPNSKLRKRLEKLKTDELVTLLKKKDPHRAKNIGLHNRRRLIRALEIADALGRVPALKKKPLNAEIIFIGIRKPKNELKKLLEKRVRQWLRRGLLKEIENLLKMKISQKRFQEFGLVYVWALKLYKKEINRREFIDGLTKELLQYAKRQMTWFKRDKRIHWITKIKELHDFTP